MTDEEKQIETRLRARKEDLADRMVRLDRHVKRAAAPLTRDFAEQAVERQNDEVVDALWKATVEELRDVNAALGRLQNRSYGACESCGAPIAPSRLLALPCTTLCTGCAAEASTDHRHAG